MILKSKTRTDLSCLSCYLSHPSLSILLSYLTAFSWVCLFFFRCYTSLCPTKVLSPLSLLLRPPPPLHPIFSTTLFLPFCKFVRLALSPVCIYFLYAAHIMLVCAGAHRCVCVCVHTYALRIVSMDMILCFKNTFIIYNIY